MKNIETLTQPMKFVVRIVCALAAAVCSLSVAFTAPIQIGYTFNEGTNAGSGPSDFYGVLNGQWAGTWAGSTYFRPGQSGKPGDFSFTSDPSGNRVRVWANDVFGPVWGSFTVEAHFTVGAAGSFRRLVTLEGFRNVLEKDSSNRLRTTIAGDIRTDVLEEDRWHHAAAVYNVETGIGSLYLDGNLVGSAPIVEWITPEAVFIGASATGGNRWNGFIDNVRLSNAALSPNEFLLEGFGTGKLVRTRAELQAAVSAAAPGAEIVIANGVWHNEQIVIDGTGSAQWPIIVRAQTPGEVALTGQSSLEARGSHIWIEGLRFQDGWLESGHVVRLRGTHQRLRQTVIDSYNPPDRNTRYFWVSLFGTHNIVEECTFRGMDHSGVTVVVWRDTSDPDFHIIRRNYFADRPRGTGNGWETIRIGTSEHSLSDSHTVVEENLFERCDGEWELISNKSGRNIYRRNTVRASKGTLSLRHGNHCVVDSNFFFGEDISSTGGIRVIGEDHLIINNYIEGTRGEGGAAIALNSGDTDSQLAGYFAAHRAVVAFNTIVGVTGAHIHLSQASRSILPQDVVIANNLLEAGNQTGGSFVSGTVGPGLLAEGNVGHGRTRGSLPEAGITMADPLLKRGEGGLLRPAAGSPVLGAAIGWYPQVDHDIDGQWRNDPKDVGCDQRVDEPILNRPLTPADVGAVWARAPEPVALIHPAIDAGMFRFRFISRHSRTHTVLYKESLEDAWQTLSILPGDGSEKTVSDPVSGTQRFYIVETE